MATPTIRVNDGEHKLVVVKSGERILTPEQNRKYEMGHPRARKEPMKANVVFDQGGMIDPDASVDAMNSQTSQAPPTDPNALAKKALDNSKKLAAANAMPGQGHVDTSTSPLLNQEAFDQGGDVQAEPSVGERIASRAKELLSQSKAVSAPEDNEAQAFKEKQEMVNSVAQPKPVVDPGTMNNNVPSDRMHPSAGYGMGKGEKRLYTDPQGNPINPTTPQGMGAAGPQRPVPSGLMGKAYDCGGMVYDEGGDVTVDPAKQAAISQATQEIKAEDQGGGAPADFAGPVLPNPKGIKVSDDTERPPDEPTRLSGGAKMTTDNAPLTAPKMDTSNPPHNEIETSGQLSSAKGSPMVSSGQMGKGLPAIEQPKGNAGMLPGTTDQPDQYKNEIEASLQGRTVGHDSSVSPYRNEDPAKAHLQAISDQDKLKAAAMGKDGLVDQGANMIHAKALGLNKSNEVPLPQPAAPTARENVVNQEKQLREKMLNAPTEQERFQAEKDLAELKRRTPWGSEGSAHPGMMGKLAHAASAIGQGIGQGIAPYAVNAIPGSRADIARQENLGEQGVEQAQKKEMTTAQTAVEQGKPELQKEAQGIAEEKNTIAADKNKMQHDAQLRQRGYKIDATGAEVPIPYEELSTHEQGVYDLNQAKSHAQDALAELKSAQASPDSPQSQLILAKAKAEGEKMDQAGQKLGLDVDKYKAEYLGLSHDNTPLPGAQLTSEGKPIGTKVTGAKGGQPTAMQKNKADLSENVQHNVDDATKLIRANPDLFGKVQGRFTTAAQMIGSNDAAISRLGVVIHNIAVASGGIHGQRSQQAVEAYEKDLLNRFKNSPEATIAGLKELRGSVGDFMKDGGKKPIVDPDLVPKGASAEVLDKNGKVTGHVVNNKYVALPKE
jgi:hypothetical protein